MGIGASPREISDTRIWPWHQGQSQGLPYLQPHGAPRLPAPPLPRPQQRQSMNVLSAWVGPRGAPSTVVGLTMFSPPVPLQDRSGSGSEED